MLFRSITDPGTAMEKRAREHGFRRIFLNRAEIGGRYSALSHFGLVPAPKSALADLGVAAIVIAGGIWVVVAQVRARRQTVTAR